MTINELTAKREALLAAIATGTTEVSFGDRTIRYQAVSQMLQALALIDKELAVAGGSTTSRSILVQHSRG